MEVDKQITPLNPEVLRGVGWHESVQTCSELTQDEAKSTKPKINGLSRCCWAYNKLSNFYNYLVSLSLSEAILYSHLVACYLSVIWSLGVSRSSNSVCKKS